MDSVKNKVVLITGSSSGIGAATAVLFAKYGAKLVVTGRNEEKLNKTVEQCVAAGLEKDKVLAVAGEVSNDAYLDKLMEATITKFGTLNILVNNAGFGIIGNVDKSPIQDLDAVYRVNLRAPIYITKLAIPHLKKTKGSIINISTVSSQRPAHMFYSYCVTKAGLDMFAKSLALELAPYGVRVNTIRPGCIKTGIHQRMVDVDLESPESKQLELSMIQNTPMGCMGKSEDIAQAVVFLASDASSFTTGAFLEVDGGIYHTAAWTQEKTGGNIFEIVTTCQKSSQ